MEVRPRAGAETGSTRILVECCLPVVDADIDAAARNCLGDGAEPLTQELVLSITTTTARSCEQAQAPTTSARRQKRFRRGSTPDDDAG